MDRRIFLRLILGLWLASISHAHARAAIPTRLTFGNEIVALQLSFSHGHLRLESIDNRLTGDRIELQNARFRFVLSDGTQLDSRQCVVDDVAASQLPAAGRRAAGRQVVVRMRARDSSVAINAVYTARRGEHWIEQYLEVTGAPGLGVARVVHADWVVDDVVGPTDRGKLADGSLGYPDGCGQPVYLRDAFVGILHPGAENFRTTQGLACAIPASITLDPKQRTRTDRFVIGVARRGARRRAFVKFLYAWRQRPPRMVILINDWYWKNKKHPLQDLKALADVKRRTGVPIDSFTFDDGWSTYTDAQAGLWGKLDETRFGCTWNELMEAARSAGMNVSLWFGPIGGYGYRSKRLPMARKLGFEINGDKLCMAGTTYNAYVRTAFQKWARQGMDYIKVDGFWPNCAQPDHGHPTGPGGAIAQMDALADTFESWRAARRDLLIGYTSGSNPSPFWLLHADYLWRGGADDAHQGVGTPSDQYMTFVDRCLQLRRGTEVPISAFVTFDLISRRILPADDATLRRCFWWSAARGSLNHDWYLYPTDLTDTQWRTLGAIARWAKQHVDQFQFARMIGGDVLAGQAYGFAAFNGRSGTLALRNPSDRPRTMSGSLTEWLELTDAERTARYRITPVFGQTDQLVGTRAGDAKRVVQLPPFQIAVVEVTVMP